MMLLRQLVEGLSHQVSGPSDVAIEDVVFDSRRVRPGSLFVALRGTKVDGHRFLTEAVSKGARALLTEEPATVPGATIVQVPDTLQALSHIALRFWSNPSQKLLMVGITGTNGKTTTSFLVESILEAGQIPTGVMGTIEYRFHKNVQPAPNTTPFASELQRFLATVLSKGGKACAMEVSSHALALGRVEGVEFDVGVFTNLTQDHLDFHKTMEAYAAAKMKLFETLAPSANKRFPKAAVLNIDDPLGERFATVSQVPVITYGLKHSATIRAQHVQCDASGSRFELVTSHFTVPVKLPLLGEYNVLNALAAVGVGVSQKLSADVIRKGLEAVKGVPGRMERVDEGQPYTVVVDYAHTDDALRNVLQSLRRLKPNRLITVFGCGGDRDRTKRPLMGEVAATLSDLVYVTSDNPRTEDPSRIALDVEVGVRRVRADGFQVILDRETAIQSALQAAQPGDIVLVAGKGHETYQILKDRTIPFDDRDVIRRLLNGGARSS